MDFRVVMAMFFEITLFLTHPVDRNSTFQILLNENSSKFFFNANDFAEVGLGVAGNLLKMQSFY